MGQEGVLQLNEGRGNSSETDRGQGKGKFEHPQRNSLIKFSVRSLPFNYLKLIFILRL